MKASLVKEIRNIPATPVVLKRIAAVVANPESSADDLVNVVKLDPAIAGRILKLANSAYFGFSHRISSLKNAVVLLGQKRIHSLVIASTLASKFHFFPALKFRIENYWRHSIAVAQIAEAVAKYTARFHPVDSEETYCAALLHDIGKLVLCGFEGPMVADVVQNSIRKQVAFHIAEDQENSHTYVGELIATHWDFPPELVSGISFHHNPGNSPEQFQLLCTCVHIADVMAHFLSYRTFDNEYPPIIDEAALRCLLLSVEQLRVIANKAVENQKKVESLVTFF